MEIRRVATGILLALLAALALSPAVDAMPAWDTEILFWAVAATFLAVWLVARSPRSTVWGIAFVGAAVLAYVLTLFVSPPELLQRSVNSVFYALVPCDGGCGVARAESIQLGLTLLVLVPVLGLLAIRSRLVISYAQRFFGAKA